MASFTVSLTLYPMAILMVVASHAGGITGANGALAHVALDAARFPRLPLKLAASVEKNIMGRVVSLRGAASQAHMVHAWVLHVAVDV